MVDIARIKQVRIAAIGLIGPLFAVCALDSADAQEIDLPPDVQADIYLMRADRQVEEGDYAAAFETLNTALALQSEVGVEFPDTVWFKHALAALESGSIEIAEQSAVLYVQSVGREGAHYSETLEIFDRVAQARERADLLADAMPEMVRIPVGSFRMGCVSGRLCEFQDEPRVVTISQPFELSKYEVTFAQWDTCVADGGCDGYWPDDEGWGRGRRPVINVGLGHITSYLSWLSRVTGEEYQLPSDAEWVYAARAGTTTMFSWGNEPEIGRANCSVCGSQWDDSQTAPVGSFAPNPWGLYDMHGNVNEWVGGGKWRGAVGTIIGSVCALQTGRTFSLDFASTSPDFVSRTLCVSEASSISFRSCSAPHTCPSWRLTRH